jgi:hypothetical protein
MKFPGMRKELIEYLEGLGDKVYQYSCWVNKECPKGIEYDELDYAVHFFFDDTNLSETPEELIGYCLSNESEAHAVKAVCSALQYLFDKYGFEKTDEEYICCSEWDKVVDAANKAVDIIK